MMKSQLSPLKKIFTALVFLSGIFILLATSESDIASVDSGQVFQKLAKDQEETSFTIKYTNGPFEFNNYPLILNLRISHVELNETYDFSGQSWTLVIEGEEGTRSQRVLFRRGMDDILYADHGEFTLSGTTSLYGCNESNENDACIPCSVSKKDCTFDLSFVREGAPYPEEELILETSQWTMNETSVIKLDITAN